MHRNLRALAASAMIVVMHASPSRAALCGDTTGDGFFSTTDALATLVHAVRSTYDRRGDVWPQPHGDGALKTSDALESLRATVGGRIPSCRGANATRAFISTAPVDFSSGGIAVIDIAGDPATRKATTNPGSTSPDAVVRSPAGNPVIVNRHEWNSLQLFDLDAPGLPNVKECSVMGDINANPQDVVFVNEHKGFVTPYAGSELFVIDPSVLADPDVDPACNGILTGAIDLSSFDPDETPEMDQMALVGDNLFVTLQRLESGRDPTKGPGRIAVIDAVTDEVKTSIPLSFANPFATTKGIPYDEFQNHLFVGGPGWITDDVDDWLEDGAIEAIDPVAMESAGVLLTGADVNANIFDFVIVGTGRAFAIIADKNTNSVVDVNLATRTIRRTLVTSATALVSDIEMTETGELWVAYRGESAGDPPGIRIFRATMEVPELTVATDGTPKPIKLGQPPFTLTFVP